MPAYVVAQLDIWDKEGYQAYVEGFYAIFNRYNGEVLAHSRHPTEVLEGDWTPETVILRFPTAEAARAWHADPDYKELTKIRHRCAESNLALIDAKSSSA